MEDYPSFKNQAEMFQWIWNNRPRVSEISGVPLLPEGHFQWHHQFAHVLSKGSYPQWKLNPHNIMLLLPKEHEHQERYPQFMEKKDHLKREYYRMFYGKEY